MYFRAYFIHGYDAKRARQILILVLMARAYINIFLPTNDLIMLQSVLLKRFTHFCNSIVKQNLRISVDITFHCSITEMSCGKNGP